MKIRNLIYLLFLFIWLFFGLTYSFSSTYGRGNYADLFQNNITLVGSLTQSTGAYTTTLSSAILQGSTTIYNSLEVLNPAGTNLFHVGQIGAISIGGIVTSTCPLTINHANNGYYTEPLKLMNSGAAGSGTSVGMVFYNGNGVDTGAGALARIKGIDLGSYHGSLAFETADVAARGEDTTEQMRLLNNGYLGIGLINPSQKLDVLGNMLCTGNSAVTGTIVISTSMAGVYGEPFALYNTGTGAGTNVGMLFHNAGAGAMARIKAADLGSYHGALVFETGNGSGFGEVTTEWMRLLNNGRLGIGTTTPSAMLKVVGDAEVTTTLQVGGTSKFVSSMTVVNSDIGITGAGMIDVSSTTPAGTGTEVITLNPSPAASLAAPEYINIKVNGVLYVIKAWKMAP